jgi:Holliday junction resolvasome RuvABC ATP-dependent DNA helicase subunit
MTQTKRARKPEAPTSHDAEASELAEGFTQGQGEVMETVNHILGSQDPMQGVMYHLNNLIAGEEANKATIFLLLLSAKVEDAKRKQIILVKGEPGAGKTTLMGIADLFNTKKIGRFTAHALDYTDLSHFDVLELQEVGFLDQEDQGVSTLKFLSPDDKGYTVACTVRDKETGKFIAEEHRIPPITLIASTTRVELDPQFERRAWPINPDESE